MTMSIFVAFQSPLRLKAHCPFRSNFNFAPITYISLQIKDEEFTFTIADTIISPDSERYGVMLKTISEEYLPKQIKIVKDDPEEDGKCGFVFKAKFGKRPISTRCLCHFLLEHITWAFV